VPGHLDDTIAKLLEGDRERRYQTAQEVATGLRQPWEKEEEERQREIEEHDRTARALLQQERYQEAIAEWKCLLALDPQSQRAEEGIASA
jgi:type II secretory pathway component HofQ